MPRRSNSPKKYDKREEKWKKWRREQEGSYLNFKHDEVVVLNNDILINGKAAIEDIVEGENERREMKEMDEGRRRSAGGGGGGGGGAQILNIIKSLS